MYELGFSCKNINKEDLVLFIDIEEFKKIIKDYLVCRNLNPIDIGPFNNEKVVTNGGRVLSVVSSAKTMKEALNNSYLNIEKINFKGKVYRKDIGFDL